MEFKYDAYCGLCCGACPVLKANENGTLQEVARTWEEDPDDLVCHGCKTDVVCVYCNTCDFKKCAESKHVDFCFQCPEYPCSALAAFQADDRPHHSVIFENLKTIQEHGVDVWLEQQKSRWKCPECGTSFCWYDETCSTCGAPLYNSKKEEEDLG